MTPMQGEHRAIAVGARLLRGGEARRIAVNIAKLPQRFRLLINLISSVLISPASKQRANWSSSNAVRMA
jgi:hypothetical protein